MNMQYGFFCGGDPRKFFPDGESCSETELANHTAACKLWDEAEARGETPTPEACPSGFLYDEDGKCLGHVLRAPYGIGMYFYDDEEEMEYSHEDDEALNEKVERFLSWKLPKSVRADLCTCERDYPHPRSGTNLLTAVEAKQMIQHILGVNDQGDGSPSLDSNEVKK